jgi:hypothetical protein
MESVMQTACRVPDDQPPAAAGGQPVQRPHVGDIGDRLRRHVVGERGVAAQIVPADQRAAVQPRPGAQRRVLGEPQREPRLPPGSPGLVGQHHRPDADPGTRRYDGSRRRVGTLLLGTNSWWVGANIPGKVRTLYPYVGGVGGHRKICQDVSDAGYEGFTVGASSTAAS